MDAERSAATLRRDPRVRTDGLCAGCRKPKTAIRAKASGKHPGKNGATRMPRGLWLAEVAADPFCSAICARRHHGVVYASDRLAGDDEAAERRSANGRRAAARMKKAAA